MKTILTDEYLIWYGEYTRDRYVKSLQREEKMGKHSHPEDTDVLVHRGYQCEACNGFWGTLEPGGGDEPEELPCLATEGCRGPVVALMPAEDPVPRWIPVIIQGGQT